MSGRLFFGITRKRLRRNFCYQAFTQACVVSSPSKGMLSEDDRANLKLARCFLAFGSPDNVYHAA